MLLFAHTRFYKNKSLIQKHSWIGFCNLLYMWNCFNKILYYHRKTRSRLVLKCTRAAVHNPMKISMGLKINMHKNCC